jgi:hypothetical protein
VCLGPGDVQRAHDPQKEDDDQAGGKAGEDDLDRLEHDLEKTEGAGLVDVGGDLGSGGVGSGMQSLQFLVVGVLTAQGLPGYDRLISTTRRGLYAYVQCEFAGCKPLKTAKVSCSGASNLTVRFEEELWIPVWVPSLCKRVAITVKNSEIGRADQTVATAYFDFQGIRKYTDDPVKYGGMFSSGSYDGECLTLLHFYGANSQVRSGSRGAKFMNKFPNHGSSYRGSLLCRYAHQLAGFGLLLLGCASRP